MNIDFNLIVFGNALLGTSTPVSKDAIAVIPPWAFMAVTGVVGTLSAYVIAALTERPKWFGFGSYAYRALAAQGLICASGTTVLTLFGLQYTSAITASVIVSTVPAATLLMAAIFLREKVNLAKVSAIALACAAVLLVSVANTGDAGVKSSILGVFLLTLSVLTNSSFFIMAKHFEVDLGPATITTCITAIATVVSSILAIPDVRAIEWQLITPKIYTETLFYGFVYWVVPTYFMYRGVSRVAASSIGMATAVTPAAAVLTAVLLYGERFSVVDATALGIVIASIFIAEYFGPERSQTGQAADLLSKGSGPGDAAA